MNDVIIILALIYFTTLAIVKGIKKDDSHNIKK